MRLRSQRRILRFTLVGVLCTTALLAGAGQALADSATISVTTGARQPDPAAGVPRVFTLSGTSSRPKQVYVKYRAPGGDACGPSAYTDSGAVFFGSVYGSSVNGNFKLSQAYTFGPAGTYVFCIWMASAETAIVTPFTQTITFRAPTGTITAAANPGAPQLNQVATLTVSGASEAPAKAYAKVRPADGTHCAPNFDADPGSGLLFGEPVNGAFSLQAQTKRGTPGSYQVCLWLAASSSDPAPIALTQARLFNVVAPAGDTSPPSSCIVPKVTHGIRIATMKVRILAGHCTPGAIRYLRSRTVMRRAIVRLSHKAGAKLAPGSRVTIYVSTGRRKR